MDSTAGVMDAAGYKKCITIFCIDHLLEIENAF